MQQSFFEFDKNLCFLSEDASEEQRHIVAAAIQYTIHIYRICFEM